jgi:hypothetical protein
MQRTVNFTNTRLALTAMCGALLCITSVGCGSSSSSSDSGTTSCGFTEASAIFAAKGCALGGCHDGTMATAANFDMATTGWQMNLVDHNPKGGGMGLQSVCTPSDGPYLMKGSNPATGLFIRKITGVGNLCTGGQRMPYLQSTNYLNQHDIDCVTSWATTLTTAP